MSSTRSSPAQELEGSALDVDPVSGALRIGEAARACGVTTRTLRYWQEIGLLTPGGHRDGGERLYTAAEVQRAARIKELQGLLGFSLSEIREVLDIEDGFDKLRSAYKADTRPEMQLRLLADAIEANDKLLSRLEDALERITAFRDERAAKAKRLRGRARELEAELSGASKDSKSSPGAGPPRGAGTSPMAAGPSPTAESSPVVRRRLNRSRLRRSKGDG
jgi:MerR family transcriptional regulator, repressor of the yfmOP operon